MVMRLLDLLAEGKSESTVAVVAEDVRLNVPEALNIGPLVFLIGVPLKDSIQGLLEGIYKGTTK